MQKARKVFSVDTHVTKVEALIRRRTERAASDQSLFFLSLHKSGFPYDITYATFQDKFVQFEVWQHPSTETTRPLC